MKQIPCPTCGAPDGNVKFHLQTVQRPVSEAVINNRVRGLLVMEWDEIELCLTGSQCHTGCFHGDGGPGWMDLIKEALQSCSKMGKSRVGSKSCQELMINGTRDRCLFKFAFVLGISWTLMSPFSVKWWNGSDTIRAYPNCHHHGNQTQTNPFQSCLEFLIVFHWVIPTFAYFWTPWLSVQVAQDVQMRTLCYTWQAFPL